METIRIVFQTEAAHVAVPENYGRAGEWQSVRQRIEKAGKPTITDMEALLDELRLLCEALEADRDRAREAFAQASARRNCSNFLISWRKLRRSWRGAGKMKRK